MFVQATAGVDHFCHSIHCLLLKNCNHNLPFTLRCFSYVSLIVLKNDVELGFTESSGIRALFSKNIV